MERVVMSLTDADTPGKAQSLGITMARPPLGHWGDLTSLRILSVPFLFTRNNP